MSDTPWQDEWRHLTIKGKGWMDGGDMAGARRLVAEKARRADEHGNIEFIYELQKAVERLEREVTIYAQRLQQYREDVGYFVAAVVQHRTLLAKKEQAETRGDLLDDDAIVDRLAAFYKLPKQGPK